MVISSLFSLLASLCALLSSLSSLLPSLFSHPSLLSLLLLSQISLRTCPFELRIRPSITLPIHSTLCLTILGPNYCLLRPSHLDCVCLSLLASLCALPSSLLGADPFLHHPARQGPNHCLLSCILSLLSSLFPLRSLSFSQLAAFFVISSLLSLLASLCALLSLISAHFCRCCSSLISHAAGVMSLPGAYHNSLYTMATDDTAACAYVVAAAGASDASAAFSCFRSLHQKSQTQARACE